MKPVLDLFACLWNALGSIGELLGYLLRFVGAFFRTRASLAARLLAAEGQLAMCRRYSGPRTSQGQSEGGGTAV